MSCPICTEKCSNPVTCAKCNGYSCGPCFQEYLLNCSMTPLCMHCRASLSDDFVLDNTKVGWRSSKYKVYKEKLLYDIERARFPETQPAAELYQNARVLLEPLKTEYEVVAPRLASLRKRLNENQIKIYRAYSEPDDGKNKDLVSEQKALRKERGPVLKRYKELRGLIDLYKPIVVSYGLTAGANKITEKRVYMKACVSDGCNGFLNADFECGLCAIAVCKKCHEIKADDLHECNEDTVASVKALKDEAKPCPSCATLISKIDGCDQMWCTQCKTTFSWRTGLRETGHTHNPHYYEWMRKNGGVPRAPGDVPVCGFPGYNQLYDSVLKKVFESARDNGLDKNVGDETFAAGMITYYHREIVHFNAMNLVPIAAVDNHELRVKLLTKELDEEKFKVLLQRVDKAYRKSIAKRQIYDMTYQAAGDIFRNMFSGASIVDTYKSIDSLLKYSNTALKRVSVSYSCVVDYYNIIESSAEPMTYNDLLLKIRP